MTTYRVDYEREGCRVTHTGLGLEEAFRLCYRALRSGTATGPRFRRDPEPHRLIFIERAGKLLHVTET